ncbi:MAG: MFS transporter [Leptospiraceae bacterium]|nr:MFS transporter [Leptospiraceae bacterium]MCK6382558.1 MFS transporter [Leptospiraceae bacterium]
MKEQGKVSKKELFGWCMFDFANSSYTTVIISVTYGIIFSQLIVPTGTDPKNPYQEGNALWGIALAISYLLVVFTGPIFGAITDFSARKKTFLFLSYVFCIISTASLWFIVQPGMVALAFMLIVISNFFFASGENFASSFLPFLGPKEELGKISGYAWGVGYFGGIASVILVSTLGEVIPENFEKLRLVGPYTAAFFLIAGIPTFIFLKEYADSNQKPKGVTYLKIGFSRLIDTLRDINKFKDMAIYLISLFFSMAALGIVVSFAFIYGDQEIKIENIHKTAMFLMIQVNAALGAVIFGFIQDKIGAKKTFNITLIVWIVGVLLINQVANLTNGLNFVLGAKFTTQWVFVGLSAIAGLGLGATQSASRALVGVLSPESKSGEFFGLWGLSGKIASAFGLFAIAWLQMIFSLRDAFLAIAVFFVLSLLINIFVNEERGIKIARDYKD